MEQLNRVELRGNVGNVRIQNVGGRTVAHFTMATSLAYRDKTGTPVIETTWHNLTAWEGKEVRDLDTLGKGSKVHIVGRLRCQRYTNVEGEDRSITEILVNRLSLIDDKETLQYEL